MCLAVRIRAVGTVDGPLKAHAVVDTLTIPLELLWRSVSVSAAMETPTCKSRAGNACGTGQRRTVNMMVVDVLGVSVRVVVAGVGVAVDSAEHLRLACRLYDE